MFQFSSEHEMIRQAVRQWVDRRLRPANAELERAEKPPYELMRDFVSTFGIADMARASVEHKLARAAAAAPAADEAPGTQSTALQTIVGIEMSRVSPGFYLAFGASTGLAGGAIMARGTPEQQREYGLPILTMDKIGAWGMTEPGAGSDAFGAMRTVARRVGDDYVISGQKTFITNAPFADTYVIYAKIDDGSGVELRDRPIDAFVIERGTPGLTAGPPMRKMGMHASPTGEIFLADCKVPARMLLGGAPRAAGRAGAKDVFQGERTGVAAMCLGIIEECLDRSLAYAKERVTWGQPIGQYQLIQDKLARMFVARLNVENLILKQLWLAKERRSPSPAEASATKLYAARAATDCAMEAVQLMGGNGYMTEYHVEQLARDAKLLQIGGGTDEIQIVAIARHLLR
jgi:alkylation response protein AidB-like acyl-CoA dehydrogenase